MPNVVSTVVGDEDAKCVVIDEPTLIAERYSAYLSDESKCDFGSPALVAFPTSLAQVLHIVRRCRSEKRPITVSSGRTGLVGGAVALSGGAAISLERMNTIGAVREEHGAATIRVGAGVRLDELQKVLREQNSDWFYPVDPSDASACFGGMVATNASGARTYFYGPTRSWVNWLRVVLINGEVLEVRRGERGADNGELIFKFSDGEKKLSAGEIATPDTKCTAGYWYSKTVDPIDIFIGSEGTLGIVTDVELRLARRPVGRLYYVQFFTDEEVAFRFVEEVKADQSLQALAIEFVDGPCLRLATESPAQKISRTIQMIKPDYDAAVFCDFVYKNDDEVENISHRLEELAVTVGASTAMSFAGTSDQILQDIKVFRHAIPERINAMIAERKRSIPSLHKISTDVSVGGGNLRAMIDFYRSHTECQKLEHYIFGHIGSDHLHVNFVPRNESEQRLAMELYREFAVKAVSLGGSIAGEHGIGRLKTKLLSLQYSDEEIASMRKIKDFFDPDALLGRGVLFETPQ